MSVWMLAGGFVLLAVVTYDALSTTLVTTTAAGPLTGRVGAGLTALARRAARRPGSVLLQLTGPLVLVTTIVVWLLLLWAGWTLILSAATDAVVHAETGEPADGWSRVYYAAFTTFTLGIGDLVPNGAVWQVLTGISTISGLALTTMAITYLIPVVTAVTARRTQANTIAGLGDTPAAIVLGGWHRGSFAHLEQRFPRIADGLVLTGERHLSYPVLHFFHTACREDDLTVQAVILDEAVTLLSTAVPADVAPHPGALASVRQATRQLLTRTSGGDASARLPSPGDLDLLRDAGIPTVDATTFAHRLEDVVDHRRQLARFATRSPWPTRPAPDG